MLPQLLNKAFSMKAIRWENIIKCCLFCPLSICQGSDSSGQQMLHNCWIKFQWKPYDEKHHESTTRYIIPECAVSTVTVIHSHNDVHRMNAWPQDFWAKPLILDPTCNKCSDLIGWIVVCILHKKNLVSFIKNLVYFVCLWLVYC